MCSLYKTPQPENCGATKERNYGSAPRATRQRSQRRAMLLPAATHNIAIILFLKELCYRVYRTRLFPPSIIEANAEDQSTSVSAVDLNPHVLRPQ
jgi:hypothetical protein